MRTETTYAVRANIGTCDRARFEPFLVDTIDDLTVASLILSKLVRRSFLVFDHVIVAENVHVFAFVSFEVYDFVFVPVSDDVWLGSACYN